MSTNAGEMIVGGPTEERHGKRAVTTARAGSVDASARRRIDVTDMDARSVQEFARENVGTDRVSFEHRGARTFLVVEE